MTDQLNKTWMRFAISSYLLLLLLAFHALVVLAKWLFNVQLGEANAPAFLILLLCIVSFIYNLYLVVNELYINHVQRVEGFEEVMDKVKEAELAEMNERQDEVMSLNAFVKSVTRQSNGQSGA